MNTVSSFLFIVILLVSQLSTAAVTLEFKSSVKDYEFADEEKALIQEIADAAEAEIRVLLPALDEQLVVEVEASTFVIPQTGELGGALSPGRIKWTVDPTRDGGVSKTAKAYLRQTLFHEFHHLVRGYVFSGGHEMKSFMDAVVSEGLATVFARDFAGASAPWADYPSNVDSWVTEVLDAATIEKYDQWMFQHPDGRSWIGYKVGTYLADRAMQATGKSTVELVDISTDEVIQLLNQKSQDQKPTSTSN